MTNDERKLLPFVICASSFLRHWVLRHSSFCFTYKIGFKQTGLNGNKFSGLSNLNPQFLEQLSQGGQNIVHRRFNRRGRDVVRPHR